MNDHMNHHQYTLSNFEGAVQYYSRTTELNPIQIAVYRLAMTIQYPLEKSSHRKVFMVESTSSQRCTWCHCSATHIKQNQVINRTVQFK